MVRRLVMMAMLLLPGPALASSPAAWAAGDAAAKRLCTARSGLDDASATAPVHFSDRSGKSVLLVSGRYPQRALKGQSAAMLCLYDRRTGQAELADADVWTKVAK